ncbi:MAG: hypothetical protein RIR11_1061 [Bacteroidota bacterium]
MQFCVAIIKIPARILVCHFIFKLLLYRLKKQHKTYIVENLPTYLDQVSIIKKYAEREKIHYLCTVKKLIIWILVLQFATGHNLIAELLRMPILIEHYKTHQEESPELSFAHFLWLHYSNTSHAQSDGRHAQLPMHCSHGVLAETTIPVPPQIDLPHFIVKPSKQDRMLVSDEFLRLSAPLSGVFRPPLA